MCLLLDINVLVVVGGDGLRRLGAGERTVLGGSDTVDVLLKNDLLVALLELGLEILEAGGVGGRVGAAASVGHVEAGVLDLLSVQAPRLDVRIVH